MKTDLYTSSFRPMVIERQKPDVSMKSKSKKKPSERSKLNKSKESADLFMTAPNRAPLIRSNRSPIKFKTLASVKSATQLKGFEYIKELDRSSSKRKDLRY